MLIIHLYSRNISFDTEANANAIILKLHSMGQYQTQVPNPSAPEQEQYTDWGDILLDSLPLGDRSKTLDDSFSS